MGGLYRRLFLDPWERINRAAAEERARHPGFDSRVVIVLVLSVIARLATRRLERMHG